MPPHRHTEILPTPISWHMYARSSKARSTTLLPLLLRVQSEDDKPLTSRHEPLPGAPARQRDLQPATDGTLDVFLSLMPEDALYTL